MQFELNSKAILTGMDSETSVDIQEGLTISNPAYTKAEKKGQSTDRIPRYLKFYEKTQNGFICPRGAAIDLHMICLQNGENINVVDNRLKLDPVDFTFNGTLRPYQQRVVNSIVERRAHGILVSPEGNGEISMGLNIITQRKQTTLIICHTNERLNHWIDAIEKSLGIPASEVGLIGGNKFSIGDRITVALIKSLYRQLDDVTPYIGHLVVDECHRIPSKTFRETVNAFPARFRLGLTTNSKRSDGLHRVVQWYVGPITGRFNQQNTLDCGDLNPGVALFIPTGFKPITDPSDHYGQALNEMILDLNRNQFIASTVLKYKGEDLTLILSEQEEHCETLADILNQKYCLRSAVLTDKTPAKQKQQILKDLKAREYHYVVATNKFIMKGFDFSKINTLASTTPLKDSGRLIQYVCRELRQGFGKDKAVILDFVDDHGEFVSSTRARWRAYEQQGIHVKIGF